jgi:hypothetical protein
LRPSRRWQQRVHPANLFDDAHAAIWSELRGEKPIDEYRRNLQRGSTSRTYWPGSN